MDKLALSNPSTNVVLVGDFNATSPSWCSTDQYNMAGKHLEPVFSQTGLHQCVSSPTHLSPSGDLGALLDLVLVSDSTIVSNISTHPPLGKSGHLIVTCKLVSSKHPQRSTRGGRRISKAFQEMNQSAVSSSMDVNTAWSSWKSSFFSVAPQFISKNGASWCMWLCSCLVFFLPAG